MELLKKTVSAMLLLLLVVSLLASAFSVQLVKASGTVYIRADGSIDPITAPIQRDGNVYTFTDNIYEPIVIERDNIIVDGNDYTLQGTGTENGFFLDQRNDVTIKNTNIEVFRHGFYLESSSNTHITDNMITKCNYYGIYFWHTCTNNEISRNTITNNNNGIELSGSFNSVVDNSITNNNQRGVELGGSMNTIEQNIIEDHWYGIYMTGTSHSVSLNDITNNAYGIWVQSGGKSTIASNNITGNREYGIYVSCSGYNTLTLNNIEKNRDGVYLYGTYPSYADGNTIILNNIANNRRYGLLIGSYSRYNIINHNNFIDNDIQASSSSTNYWDDGYPLGGNYWSDYNGTDFFSGPDQDELGSDGIGDTPYNITTYYQDQYPLMYAVLIPPSEKPPVAGFTCSPSHPYNPVVGQAVAFDASQSKRAMRYTWNFADGNIISTANPKMTHSYSTAGTYSVKLTVTDRYGRTDTDSKAVTVKNPVVILVHGFQSGEYDPEEIWRTMSGSLTNDGFTVHISHYANDMVTCLPIQTYAEFLGEEIEKIKHDEEVDKVDIVAHSMGGLVSRWYVEMGYGYKNVRKLIMLETPNGGLLSKPFPIPEIATLILAGVDARVKNVADSIDFAVNTIPLIDEKTKAIIKLIRINAYIFSNLARVFEVRNWDSVAGIYAGMPSVSSSIIEKVHYVNIVGWLRYIPIVSTVFGLDGVATEPVSGGHGSLPESEEVIQKVKDILHDDPKVSSSELQGEQAGQIQYAPLISDKILPGELKSHEIAISSAALADFTLAWSEGDLNLTLITPNGTLIDPSYAANNTNVTFYSDENVTIEGYTIKNPESGTWQVNVTAADIADEQNYMIVTLLDTGIILSLELQKSQYNPNEPVTIRANLTYGGEAITEAFVTARIQKPDGATENITLYDDGLHSDNQTNDGVYANTYMNTSLGGIYDITVTATGTVDGKQFGREAFATIRVEQYPDLALSESDIYFSNEDPYVGEVITINATIHNLGEADANNASIIFYDGNPANGTSIGKDAINVTAGEAKNATIQWIVTPEPHEIYVLVSPYNKFLESNYTNNIAYRPIEAHTHDIAATSLNLSKTVVGQSYFVSINLTVENQGYYIETFNVTAYANETITDTITGITLTSGNSTTITFTWNTTGFTYGNYTISAYATPVPGETDIADNTFVDSWIVVTIAGDTNGDFKADHKDLLLLASAYGSEDDDPNYIPEADINGDGRVDHKDLLILAANYGKTC